LTVTICGYFFAFGGLLVRFFPEIPPEILLGHPPSFFEVFGAGDAGVLLDIVGTLSSDSMGSAIGQRRM